MSFVVYSIFLLETLQTALSGADLYYWFAAGFGNVERLATPYASAFDTPIMGSVVSLYVQFFFVYRIWVLSKKRWWLLCVFICLVTPPSKSHISGYPIFSVVLLCRRSSRFHGRHLCESPPVLVRNMTQLRQTHVQGKFASGRTLKVLALVKSSNIKDGLTL
jgi:hypothetical protein